MEEGRVDARILELTRQHRSGDTTALTPLVRALERAGDQAALCELGYHDVDPSRGPALNCKKPSSVGPSEWARWLAMPHWWSLHCGACEEDVPIPWVWGVIEPPPMHRAHPYPPALGADTTSAQAPLPVPCAGHVPCA